MTTPIHDRRVYQKGSKLFSQDDASTCAYLIHTGRIQVYRETNGEKHAIAELGAGEICGEMALILERDHSATAEAMEQTIVYIIDHKLLRTKLMSADPLVKAIVLSLSSRLSETDNHLLSDGHFLVDLKK